MAQTELTDDTGLVEVTSPKPNVQGFRSTGVITTRILEISEKEGNDDWIDREPHGFDRLAGYN